MIDQQSLERIFKLHYYQQMFDAEAYGVPMKMNKPEFSFDLKSWFVINTTAKALLQASYTGSNHWAFMYRGTGAGNDEKNRL